MSEKKDRERVTAEITLSHLMRWETNRAVLQPRTGSRILNQEGRAFEMWKHMMQAG